MRKKKERRARGIMSNQPGRSDKEQDCKKETKDSPQPIMVVETASSKKDAEKGTGNGHNAENPYPRFRWQKFKNWISKITIAEALMLLLTGAIAYASITYTEYAKLQWKTMKRQLDDSEAGQRGILVVENFSPTLKTGNPGQGEFIEGEFKVTNVGHSVADQINIARVINLSRQVPPPPVRNFDKAVFPNIAQNGPTLPEGKSLEVPFGYQVGLWDEVVAGRAYVEIDILIAYRDVFGRYHTYPGCFRYAPDYREFRQCPAESQ